MCANCLAKSTHNVRYELNSDSNALKAEVNDKIIQSIYTYYKNAQSTILITSSDSLAHHNQIDQWNCI